MFWEQRWASEKQPADKNVLLYQDIKLTCAGQAALDLLGQKEIEEGGRKRSVDPEGMGCETHVTG